MGHTVHSTQEEGARVQDTVFTSCSYPTIPHCLESIIVYGVENFLSFKILPAAPPLELWAVSAVDINAVSYKSYDPPGFGSKECSVFRSVCEENKSNDTTKERDDLVCSSNSSTAARQQSKEQSDSSRAIAAEHS